MSSSSINTKHAIHLDAVPALARLSEITKELLRDALKQALTSEQQKSLLKNAIAAMKGAGITSGEISAEVHGAYPQHQEPIVIPAQVKEVVSPLQPVPTPDVLKSGLLKR